MRPDPGNSGGRSSIARTRDRHQYRDHSAGQGICFAIPINMQAYLAQLLQHGRVVRRYLGVHRPSLPIPRALARKFELTQTHGWKIYPWSPTPPQMRAGILEMTSSYRWPCSRRQH